MFAWQLLHFLTCCTCAFISFVFFGATDFPLMSHTMRMFDLHSHSFRGRNLHQEGGHVNPWRTFIIFLHYFESWPGLSVSYVHIGICVIADERRTTYFPGLLLYLGLGFGLAAQVWTPICESTYNLYKPL